MAVLSLSFIFFFLLASGYFKEYFVPQFVLPEVSRWLACLMEVQSSQQSQAIPLNKEKVMVVQN